jgi:hypothetical protein
MCAAMQLGLRCGNNAVLRLLVLLFGWFRSAISIRMLNKPGQSAFSNAIVSPNIPTMKLFSLFCLSAFSVNIGWRSAVCGEQRIENLPKVPR